MSMKSLDEVNHRIHRVSKISPLSKIHGFAYVQQVETLKEAFSSY